MKGRGLEKCEEGGWRIVREEGGWRIVREEGGAG